MSKELLWPEVVHSAIDEIQKTYEVNEYEIVMYSIEHLREITCKDTELFTEKLNEFIKFHFTKEKTNA